MRIFVNIFRLARRPKQQTEESASFVVPSAIVTLRPIAPSDFELVKKLSDEFIAAGVLDRRQRDAFLAEAQSPEELAQLIKAAGAAAQTEKESNSAFYDPAIEEILLSSDFEDRIISEDPSLDGLDDEGIQVYESYSTEARLDTLPPVVRPLY